MKNKRRLLGVLLCLSCLSLAGFTIYRWSSQPAAHGNATIELVISSDGDGQLCAKDLNISTANCAFTPGGPAASDVILVTNIGDTVWVQAGPGLGSEFWGFSGTLPPTSVTGNPQIDTFTTVVAAAQETAIATIAQGSAFP